MIDIYQTDPFILISGKKQISTVVSQFFSFFTIIYSCFVLYNMILLRFSSGDFKVNDISSQFSGDENVNITSRSFMFAVTFEDRNLQAQFEKYFTIQIYLAEWDYNF
jgi:hypothetical protein